MVLGDDKYNRHFHVMVTCGIICGLSHPIEWLIDYQRCTAIPYDEIPEVDEFASLAWYELYELVNCKKAENHDIIQTWIDEYYSKPVAK